MKLLLIGCGHMGGAMLAGWLPDKSITQVDVIEPSAPGHPDPRVRMHPAAGDTPFDCDVAVLAVKPQIMDNVCPAIAPLLPAGASVLSIAAGVTLASLTKYFGADRPLVRAMPNTPGAIGKGITGFAHNGKLEEKQLDAIFFLLGALGNVIEVTDESMMDAVTALSGSGPAYIYAFTEALEKAGINAGLSDEVATALARQTVIGAAGLMAAQARQTPESLRHAVTSPGGTTEAALEVLLGNQALDILVDKAVQAAKKRSQELA